MCSSLVLVCGTHRDCSVPLPRCYVDQVERELLWGLDTMLRDETWTPLSSEMRVLRSSNDVVEAIKSEMRECVTRVTQGPTLLALGRVFQVGVGWGGRLGGGLKVIDGGGDDYMTTCVCLSHPVLRATAAAADIDHRRLPCCVQRVYRTYAARLVVRLPQTATGATSGAAVLGASDWHVRLSDEDMSVVCTIASTAEHCKDMVRQLARALAAKLTPPLGDQVRGGATDSERP